jgi:hypothetical protein
MHSPPFVFLDSEPGELPDVGQASTPLKAKIAPAALRTSDREVPFLVSPTSGNRRRRRVQEAEGYFLKGAISR